MTGTDIRIIEIAGGGVTTPRGFLASGIAAGLKQSGKPDIGLLASEVPAVARGAFTTNRFRAAPVVYDTEVLGKGLPVKAILINSGNANACTGPAGLSDARLTAANVADRLGTEPENVLVCSTGRIGVPLPMETLLEALDPACSALSTDGGKDAAEAIMTTDTVPKSMAVELRLDKKTVRIGGMAKGSGMIAPKLEAACPEATMLAFITTDADIEGDALRHCLVHSLDHSFNRITVDGDTSTNDSFIALANGRAGNRTLSLKSDELALFRDAFCHVASRLAREIVLDGEGVTRFVEVKVRGAQSNGDAKTCAEAIAGSALCKTAWFGADPNWGRVLCAAGYCGIEFEPANVDLTYGNVPIVRGGQDAGTSKKEQAAAMSRREFTILLDLNSGEGEFTVWTCDLSYRYVEINAEYHT